MTSRVKVFAILIFAVLTTGSYALPPSMEADRQLLAAESNAKAEDWPAAVTAYEAAAKLDPKRLPPSYKYLYANALFNAGSLDGAQSQVESYLNDATPATKFYKEALMVLNGIEQGRKQGAAKQAAAADANARKEKLNAAWLPLATIRSEWPSRGRNSCGEVIQITKQRSASARNIECRCEVTLIDHPAYRGKTQDLCRATWEANLILDAQEAHMYASDDLEGDTSAWVKVQVTRKR